MFLNKKLYDIMLKLTCGSIFVSFKVMEDNFLALTLFSNSNDGVKITNATYKLLDFFPDSDPLKNKAKEKALAVLEGLTLVFGADGWVSLKKEKAAAQLLDDIEILESYLKLGKRQGWMDNINVLILIKEYDNIKSQIQQPKGLIGSRLQDPDKVEDSRQSRNNRGSSVESGQNLEIISSPLSIAHQNDLEANKIEIEYYATTVYGDKEPVFSEKKPITTETSIEKRNPLQVKSFSERQKKILEILKNREKAQVSDIIKEIPNVTKRTLRRDLDDLLKKNTIIRVGEWNQVFYQAKAPSA